MLKVFLDKRISTNPMVCFTEMHLLPDNGLDQISYCLPNRSISRSDNRGKYHMFLSALILIVTTEHFLSP